MVAPEDLSGAAEVLRLCSGEGRRVLPLGRGTKLGWAPPIGPVDVALSTRRLTGIVAHEPADGTITALSGTTLAELAATAALGGGAITPLLPDAVSATLGGALSSGQDGLDRLRRGAPRDHVLGARLLLTDGTLVKSGGRLVKNVTGYDLHRLVCGAHGGLALIVEASLRLFSEPRATALIRVRYDDFEPACADALAHGRGADSPRRVTLRREAGGVLLEIELAASCVEVDEQSTALHRKLPSPERLDLPASAARTEDTAARAIITTRPARMASLVRSIEQLTGELGSGHLGLVEPCLGRATVRFDGEAGEIERFAAGLNRLEPTGARIQWRDRPRPAVDSAWAYGAAETGETEGRRVVERTAGVALANRIRRALDPTSTLVPRSGGA
ncbi:FAD-binding oxidoreductase [Engelhardtia mirabilis]